MASRQTLDFSLNIHANTKQAQTEFNKLQTALGNMVKEGSRVDFGGAATNNIQKATQAAKELQIHLAKATNIKTGQVELDKLNLSLKASGTNLTNYAKSLLEGGEAGQIAFAQLGRAITNAQAPTAKLTGLVSDLATKFKTAFEYQVSYGALNMMSGALRNAVNYAKDLNGVLTDIRVVTSMSADEANRLGKNALTAARNLNTSTKEILKSQLIYLQQGDSTATASLKGQITTKAAQVANVEAQQMSEYLTAVWNSYKVGSGELELFVDKLAAVGAATATSLEEISTAMTKVAATANTVGVSYDQLTATIATISSVTRTSAESVGTAMKTIYARMGDLKLGKEDEDGMQLGTVSSQLKQVGVEILDTEGNLRDMGVVVEEVGEKWQGWTEAQRTAIAQAIAGKRQYTQLMALFENWDMYIETKGVSEGASGSLEEQFKIWSDSWEAASNRVKVASESLYQNLLNDDVMIKFTDGVAGLVRIVDTLLDGMGGIPGILSLIAAQLLKIKGVAIQETFANIARNFKLIFSKESINQFEQVKNSFANLKNQMNFDALAPSTKAYAEKLIDINALQIMLEKNANKMTSEEKLGWQIQIQSIQQMHESLCETITELDNLYNAIKRIGQSQGLGITNEKIKELASKNINSRIEGDSRKFDFSKNTLAGIGINTDPLTLETGSSKDRTGTSSVLYKGLMKTQLSKADVKVYQDNLKEIRKLFTDDSGSVLQGANFAPMLDTLKNKLGETSTTYLNFVQAVESGSVSQQEFEMMLSLSTTRMSELDMAILDMCPGIQRGSREFIALKDVLEQVMVNMGNVTSGSEKIEEAVNEAGESMDKTGKNVPKSWTGIASGVMSATSAISSASSVMDTLISTMQNADATAGEWVQSLSSAGTGVTMIVIQMAQAFSAFGTTGIIFTSLGLLITVIAKIGDAAGWWKTQEEKLNEELEETKEKINELKNSTREYESAIEELREKQKTANAAEYAELEREIRLKENLLNLTEKTLQIEEKRKKELNQQKLNLVLKRNDEGKYNSGASYEDNAGYQLYNRSLNSTRNYQVNRLALGAIETEFQKNPQDITEDAIKAYEEKFQEVEQQRVTWLTELAETFSYASNSQEIQQVRDMLNDQIGYAYKDVLGNPLEGQENQILSDLFTVDPDSFKNIDKLYKNYEELFTQFKIGKDVIEKFFKTEQLEAKVAAREAQNATKITENFVKSINTVRDAQKEIKENKGWLNNSTIEEVISSMDGLGDAVNDYRLKLTEANGDSAKLNKLLQEMTQANIEGKLAKGEFNNMSQQQIEAMLREANVTNAAEMAMKLYNLSHKQAALEGKNLSVEVINDADAMQKLAEETGLTEAAIISYYVQERILNNSELSLGQKIAEIASLKTEYLEGTAAALAFNSAIAGAGTLSNYKYNVVGDFNPKKYTYDELIEKYASAPDTKVKVSKDVALEAGFIDQNQYRRSGTTDYTITVGRLKQRGDEIKEQAGQAAADAYLEKIKGSLEGFDFGSSNNGGDSGKEKTPKELALEELDWYKYQWEQRMITTKEYTDKIKEVMDSGLLSAQEYDEKLKEIWAAWDQQFEWNKSVKQMNIKEREARGIYNYGMDMADAEAVYKEAQARYQAYLNEGISEDDPRMIQWRQEVLDARSEMFNIMNKEHERIDNLADAYIEYSKVMGFNSGDSEEEATIKKYKNDIAQLDEAYYSGNSGYTWEQYQNERKKTVAELYSYTQKLIEDAADYDYEKWKETKEREKAELEAEKTIKSKGFEVTNAIADAYHELNKELQQSLTMYQYLDEETRKLLFNTEDYITLNEELNGIQEELGEKQEEYLGMIKGKTADQIEAITEQYEMQTESLMKQYEIKKAELEIEKQRLTLNNTLNERNTRMFINGQWQWVADSKAVAEAQQNLADAEYEKTKIERERDQKDILNTLDTSVNSIDLEMSQAEKAMKEFKDKLAGKEGLNSTLDKVNGYLNSAATAIVNFTSSITGKKYNTSGQSSVLDDFNKRQSQSYNSNYEYWSDGTTRTKSSSSGITVTVTDTSKYSKYAETEGSVSVKIPLMNTKFFASGTDNAPGGISRINEKGIEMWATKYGQFVELNPGDKIFNNDQFDFLYKFSRTPEEYLRYLNNNTSQAIDNSITIGGVEISGDSEEGEALRSILLRLTNNH